MLIAESTFLIIGQDAMRVLQVSSGQILKLTSIKS
jgi:hypothetical protein